MIASTRSASTTRPIHTSHIEIDVVRHFHIWILILDPFIGPEVASTLTTFFTGPQAEHHSVSSTVTSHCFSNGQHHTRSSSVVVGANTGSISTAKDVRVKCYSVHRRSDIKVSTENHPFVSIHFTPTVATDVVGFRILGTGHDRIVHESLGNDFKTKILQCLDKMQCSIFVSSITLSGPTVEITKGTINYIGRICSFIAQT